MHPGQSCDQDVELFSPVRVASQASENSIRVKPCVKKQEEDVGSELSKHVQWNVQSC